MSIKPFVAGAKIQTMLRDFNTLRAAIRNHDSVATEAAWENCERWLGAVAPDSDPARKEAAK